MSAVGELCRVVVVGPNRSAELALPAQLPLADLIPGLTVQVGGGLVEDSVGHGVVLQRLGEDPLDLELSPLALGLRDGDTLYVRPGADPMPALRYDDLIDGVAAGIHGRQGRWSAAATRWLLAGIATGVLALVLALLLLDGPVPLRCLASGGVAALLLLAVLGARALREGRVAGALAIAAVPFAALGGWLVPSIADPALTAWAPGVVAGGASATAVAVLGRMLAGQAGPQLLAVGLVAASTTVAGLLTLTVGMAEVRSVAVVVVLALVLSPMAPTLAFRLAGMRLPDLPTSAEEIAAQDDGLPDDELRRRTANAEDHLTALYVALAVVGGAGQTWLARADGWAASALSIVVCLLLALRFRGLNNIATRVVVSLSAGYGAFLLTAGAAQQLSPLSRMVLVPGLAVLAGGLLAAARSSTPRRPRPYWGRAAEIIETIVAATLLPLLLAVLGVFEFIRAIGG